MKKLFLKILAIYTLILLPQVPFSIAFLLDEEILDTSLITTGTWAQESVIINEVMWMGSSVSDRDEWIELRNLSNQEVDISHWKLYGAVAGYNGHLEIPAKQSIAPNGLYLIANKYETDKTSNLNTQVNLRSTSINLDDNYFINGPLILKNRNNMEIDRTPVQTTWPAGLNAETKHSMQRDPELNWYSCTNLLCASVTFWDIVSQDYGTPGAENL